MLENISAGKSTKSIVMQVSSAKINDKGLFKIITITVIKTLAISDIISAVVTALFSVFLSLFVMLFAVILETMSGIPLETSVNNTLKTEKLIW